MLPSPEVAVGIAPGRTGGPDTGASWFFGPVPSSSAAGPGTHPSDFPQAKASLCSCMDNLLRRRRYQWPLCAMRYRVPSPLIARSQARVMFPRDRFSQ